MMDEIDLLARIGADVAPLSDEARARTRAQILTRAHRERTGMPNSGDIIERPAAAPRRRRRMAFRVGLATVAAAAAAVAVGLPLTGPTPAYAVTKNSDGTVDVVIRQFLQPKKLQATLRDAGLRAVVDYVPVGQRCLQPRGLPVPQDIEKVHRLPKPGGGRKGALTLRFSTTGLKPDETLLLEASFARAHPERSSAVTIGVIRGPVAACRPVSTSEPAPIMDGPDGPFTAPPKTPGTVRPSSVPSRR
ncbi:hypothetical protein [Actinoallomurus sp. NPDC050550]|uniref:hypothetical protein n=1 Tax=Actinoallomurus sp. NPDC050550 TaxID=3154937 RepID=UPI0033C576CD